MPSYFSAIANYATGSTVKAFVRQWDHSTSALGHYWDNTDAEWQAADPGSSAYFTLTEVGSTGTYIYGKNSAMGTYTGRAVVFYTVGGTIQPISDSVDFVSGNLMRGHDMDYTLYADWLNGGRLDLLLDTAAAGGVAADPLSPVVVNDSRTWRLSAHQDSVTARNIVTVGAGAAVTVAMDFSRVLNGAQGGPQTSLSTVTSMTDTTGSPVITFSSVLVAPDRRCVHGTAGSSSLVAGFTHLVKVIATTTDSQTIVGYGRLKVV